jgi:hypothetical protein
MFLVLVQKLPSMLTHRMRMMNQRLFLADCSLPKAYFMSSSYSHAVCLFVDLRRSQSTGMPWVVAQHAGTFVRNQNRLPIGFEWIQD